MKTDDLCAAFSGDDFPSIGVDDHPDRSAVLAARAAVTAAVRDDEFLVECMELELRGIEQWVPRHGLVPFLTVPDRGIRFAFGYWPPGGRAGAHEHTAWTITAVCRNRLEVQTYDRPESYRQGSLVAKNRFDAPVGAVGYIYEPCIHDPRNVSRRWSLSFHAASPLDGRPTDDCVPALDALRNPLPTYAGTPYATVVTARRRQMVVRQIAGHLSQIDVRSAPRLLETCARLGTTSTRRVVERAASPNAVARRPARASRLTRTHPDLILSTRSNGDSVTLGVETPDGWMPELSLAAVARPAVEHCARAMSIDVADLPGTLTGDERREIGEALEDTCLFTEEESIP